MCHMHRDNISLYMFVLSFYRCREKSSKISHDHDSRGNCVLETTRYWISDLRSFWLNTLNLERCHVDSVTSSNVWRPSYYCKRMEAVLLRQQYGGSTITATVWRQYYYCNSMEAVLLLQQYGGSTITGWLMWLVAAASINQSVDRSIDPSINQSIDRSFNQSINQSIK